jgi:hypothetical protein
MGGESAEKHGVLSPLLDGKDERAVEEDGVPIDRVVCDEWRAGFFSKLTFSWLFPLLRLGYTRQLDLDDIGGACACCTRREALSHHSRCFYLTSPRSIQPRNAFSRCLLPYFPQDLYDRDSVQQYLAKFEANVKKGSKQTFTWTIWNSFR